MASGTAETNNSNIPQWKRDLIQRKRQQNKVLSGTNGIKLCPTFVGTLPDSLNANNTNGNQCIDASRLRNLEDRGDANSQGTTMSGLVPRTIASGASVTVNRKSHEVSLGTGAIPVACNMRLDTDVCFCPTSEDTPQFTAKTHLINEHSTLIDHFEKEDCNTFGLKKVLKSEDKETSKKTGINSFNVELRRSAVDKLKKSTMSGGSVSKASEECESDSSEELQYGPGIVNKLKSKYLNLTLREMSSNRTSVQRFRRAASLEDLLDCDDEPEKIRKYTKKSVTPGIITKSERFRNPTRGVDSMKRARSVETLMRYQACEDNDNKLNSVRQESVNDHIVLIDRTAVKIGSRLMNNDQRPKTLNKPKRLKPLLSETERPPPDLVKTTMRIFEGSVKKLKPKGDVAVKVATFKTINDTFKAQTMKKLMIPKPPIQPKPFMNNIGKAGSSSPKKVVPTKPPTAELIEKPDLPDEYKNNDVVTDPIVQSVSSVVSKFQKIEMSHSQSPSPEPSQHKLGRFSPISSPEPPLNKFKAATNSEVTPSTPPTTIKSPRILSPVISPLAPPPKPELTSAPVELEKFSLSDSEGREMRQNMESPTLEDSKINDESKQLSPLNDVDDKDNESVDGGIKSMTRSSLENISKAGNTMQFSFDHESPSSKNYLPRTVKNGSKLCGLTNGTSETLDESTNADISNDSPKKLDQEQECTSASNKIQEILDTYGSVAAKDADNKIGDQLMNEASLSLVKSPIVKVGDNNECKVIKSPKSESLPSQKQIGIIRPLVSSKTQVTQKNLSNRELEKNLINRVKSIEQPTKVVVSLKSADEIQPVKKGSSENGGLWDTKPWNQQNNTMVFNFSNRKDVPDYIENDGLIIRRKRDKPKQVGDGGVIVLDATLDSSSTDDSDWELSGGPPSPCDVSFLNDNILINGRSNLSTKPKNQKNRIQFDDTATRTFEYPSEASMLEDESCIDGETSASGEQSSINNKSASSCNAGANPILGGGSLATYTPSKVDLTAEGFELGVTKSSSSSSLSSSSTTNSSSSIDQQQQQQQQQQQEQLQQTQNESNNESEEYIKSDAAAWGAETTADLLY